MSATGELVAVLKTQDLALITVAKSLLEGGGVECAVENQIFQDLIGMGRMGVNVAAGVMRILVRAEDEPAARTVLSDLVVAKSSLRTSSAIRLLFVLLFGILPAILAIIIAAADSR